jgi:hypothetical protein
MEQLMFFDEGNKGDETDAIRVSSYVVNVKVLRMFFMDNQLCIFWIVLRYFFG